MSIESLGPWLHNVHLPDGRQTAPDHPLGDWPAKLWKSFRDALPEDLSGQRVLDVGCNAGFYTFELAKRGAHVVAVDPNPRYMRQATWLRKELGLEDMVVLRQQQVYDLARWDDRFDIVLFMGLFYHLRYPLLGLDVAARRCAGTFVFQSLSYGEEGDGRVTTPQEGVEDGAEFLAGPAWPKMAFVEDTLFQDQTNWWVPERKAIPALLRSAGLEVERVAGGNVYLCRVGDEARPERLDVELLAATGQPWEPSSGMFDPVQGTLEAPGLR